MVFCVCVCVFIDNKVLKGPWKKKLYKQQKKKKNITQYDPLKTQFASKYKLWLLILKNHKVKRIEKSTKQL